MSVVIFSGGCFVFFITVYGTVVAGGMQLTKKQIAASPELSSNLNTKPEKLTTPSQQSTSSETTSKQAKHHT
ncbi:MAG: hypothetical protein P8N13_09545 [Ilumatobacter sp.]|nr:hypothetical protein [Ilumatobacter sp.]